MSKKQTSSRSDRQSAKRQREQKQKRQRYIFFGIIGAGIVLVAVLVWMASRPPTAEALNNVHTDQPAGADGMAWGGPEGAAVVIQDFSDFGCGHCGSFAMTTGQALIDRYADNPNVRFEFKPFYLSPTTMDSAVGAVCAAEQDMFWPYHDTLFDNQSLGAAVFQKSFLKQIAVAIGADSGQFDDCLGSGTARRAVNDLRSDGERLSVDSTPTFFINGVPLKGNQSLSVFTEAIDAALAEAGAS